MAFGIMILFLEKIVFFQEEIFKFQD